MKIFTKQEIIELYGQVTLGEISFSQMVEIMNERVSEEDKQCVEDIPVRKFKKGDKVRIRHGVSSKTHRDISPGFIVQMDDLIGKELTVDRYANGMVYTEESYYLHEDWLEPYEGLKKGDLAIFWQFDKTQAVVRLFDNEQGGLFQIPTYTDSTGHWWANAIKFESNEQYERFIKGGDMTYFLPHDISRCKRDDCPLHNECARWLDRLPSESYWYSYFEPKGCEDFIEKKKNEPKQKKRKK